MGTQPTVFRSTWKTRLRVGMATLATLLSIGPMMLAATTA